jgi:hypothetical protein
MAVDPVRPQALLALHGGPQQFDCWLTVMADQVVGASPALPSAWQASLSPALAWLQRPAEVLDHLLVQLEQAWHYELRTVSGSIQAVDPVSGHLVEAVPWTEANLQMMTEKYNEQPA